MSIQLPLLKDLISSGDFHHATYRCQGTVWEGIWFYKKSADGFRGYKVEGCINKSDPDYEEAEKLLAGKGISVGAYGAG
jgi:hypothetical protein